METSAHMIGNNGRFPAGQSPMRQQQSGPAAMQNNSNNFINSKQFGGGGRGGPMAPRPGYGAHGIGQKRDSSGFNVGHRGSQASADGGASVKLFVGHLPKTATEDDIRQLFAQHGNVLEVSMVRDQRVGQQHGCCFIKYATVLEAERAISAFHNRHTLPGGTSPLQVRFADGEREQTGTMEHKLFVGSLNKLAAEKDIEEIFDEFGPVDDIYIMKDEQKQSRGCAFVKYPSREMAAAAINKLHGAFTMKGCNQPLTVRFAEPKRPKVGDARNGPMFGGPGFGAEQQRPFGSRPTVSGGGHTGGRGAPGNWRPMGVANMRIPSPQVGSHPYGRPSTPSGRSGSVGGHSPSVGSISGPQNSVNGPMEGPLHVSAPVGGPARLTTPPQQGYNSSSLQHQTQAQGWLPPVQQTHQMQQQLQPPFQNQHQSTQSHSQLQTSQQSLNLQQYGQHVQSSQLHSQQPTQSQLQMQAQPSLQQYGQQVQQPSQQPHSQQPTQFHSQLQAQQSLQQYGQQLQSSQQHVQQTPFGHAPASQQQPSTYGQLPVSQSQIQPNVASSHQQIPPSMPLSSIHPQTQQLSQQQPVQQLSQQQPSSQLLQQQVPAVQNNVQPQQHLSFQQQLQSPLVPAPLVQATTQSQQQALLMRPQQQQGYYQVAPTQQAGLQQPWTFSAQPQGIVTTSSTSTLPMSAETKTTAAVAPVSVPSSASPTCVWTEHTSPEGYKYYYNSVTGESKWEKPEELTKFEQQKQLQQPQPQLQQPHQQQQPQLLQPQQQQQPQMQQSNAQQQPQLQQTQQQHQPQLQQPQQLVQPSLSTSLNYGQLPGSNDTGSAPHQYMQQSLSAPQDWTWKTRPAGA